MPVPEVEICSVASFCGEAAEWPPQWVPGRGVRWARGEQMQAWEEELSDSLNLHAG